MVSVRPQNLDFGGSGVAWGRPPNDPLSKEANSEPVCLIEAYRGLHGFCETSESGFWSFWGGIGQDPQHEPLSKEANSEPVCLIETYRGLHGFCEASESGFWRFWGGLRQTPK